MAPPEVLDALDPAVLAGDPLTPPPLAGGQPLGATPVDLVDGIPEQGTIPPPLPLPIQSPFGPSVVVADLDSEAAVLAAEAAAFRALDSGPLTPPPEANIPGPTPPPVIAPDEDRPTPPPVTVSEAVPATGSAHRRRRCPPRHRCRRSAGDRVRAGADDVPAEAAAPALAVEGALPESPMDSEGIRRLLTWRIRSSKPRRPRSLSTRCPTPRSTPRTRSRSKRRRKRPLTSLSTPPSTIPRTAAPKPGPDPLRWRFRPMRRRP